MSQKSRNTNVSVSILSRSAKQQIDSFIMKPRNIVRQSYVFPAVGQSQEFQKLNAY